MKLKVGTNTIGYAEKRNFYDLPFERYEFVKKQNINKLPAHLFFKLTNKTHQYLWNTFTDLNYHNVNHFHFFNALSTGKTPWITTFETYLPRWGVNGSLQKGFKLMSNNSCKKLIAISQCTAEIQKNIIVENHPEYFDDINSKLEVIHPPQKLIVNSYEEKSLNPNELVCTLVGQQVFSKGGRESIEVILDLRTKGHDVKLNLVSNLSTDNYASMTTHNDVKELKEILSKNEDVISHFYNIPNTKVIDLLKSSHVCLLPTYADTYGFTVLEAQAAGCPVISTDIRALPEINNEEVGWLINIPKNDFRNAKLITKSERENLSKMIKLQLSEILIQILSNPESLKIKGVNSIDRIRNEHSFSNTTHQIETIYDTIKGNI